MNNPKPVEKVYESGYAPVNGMQMYYELHGKGEPLVLIHGGGSDIDVTFGRILPFLAKYYRVLGVELQAHGHTDDRGTATSFEQDADDVYALLKYLGIAKAHVFGFSNGANTGIQLAVRHPEVVNKLVAASAFYKREGVVTGLFENMATADISIMPQPLKDAYMTLNNDEKGLQTMFERDRDRMAGFKDWPQSTLESIKAKTLYLTSNNDVVLPQHTLEMAAITPGAEAVIMRGYHGEFLGELLADKRGSRVPELTAEMLHEFLDEK